jgi:hypothetical protein
MNVDFNGLRLSVIDAYNDLISTIAGGLECGLVTVNAYDIEQQMLNLRGLLAVLAALHVANDDSCRDLSCEIELSVFSADVFDD